MKLSPRESVLIVLFATTLGAVNSFFDLFDSLFVLSFVMVVFIASIWRIAPEMARMAKQRKNQEWIDQFDGRITFNEQGLSISKTHSESSIAWSDLAKVELAWHENPFGDPQFGPYCDTDWLLWPIAGNSIRITESVNETNSQILLKAFAEFLPDFDFDYAQFKEDHKDRLFDLQGGSVTVWSRNG